jgi:hypothetical protein
MPLSRALDDSGSDWAECSPATPSVVISRENVITVAGQLIYCDSKMIHDRAFALENHDVCAAISVTSSTICILGRAGYASERAN